MRFLILFFCIFSTLLVSAQADSTAFVIKDGQVYQNNIKETPIGDIASATRLLVDNVVQQTRSFSSDVEIVKAYEKAIKGLVKYVNNFTAQTGVNVWDSLLQKDPILLKRDWYLDGMDSLFFRVNSNNFQYKIGVAGKWNRCYFLVNAIVFNGPLSDIFYRKGNRFEALNGLKISTESGGGRVGTRAVLGPPKPDVIIYESGIIGTEGAFFKWDNKSQKWVKSSPPKFDLKPVTLAF